MSSHHRCCCGGAGACCINSVCYDDMTPGECSTAGGSYQGDGSSCETNTCRPGNPACCGTMGCGFDPCSCFIPAGATPAPRMTFTGTWMSTTCATGTTLCPAYTQAVNFVDTAPGIIGTGCVTAGYNSSFSVPCNKGDCSGDPHATNVASFALGAGLNHGADSYATAGYVPGFGCGGALTTEYTTGVIVEHCRKVSRGVRIYRTTNCSPGNPFVTQELVGTMTFEVLNMFECVSARPAGEVIAPSKEILGPDGQPLTRERAVSVAGERCGDCGAERGMEGVRRMDDAGRVLGSQAAHRHRPWRLGPSRGVCAGSRGLGGLRRVLA